MRSPFPFPTDGAWIYAKPTVSEGRQFRAGDPVPPDARVRQNPRRMETLYMTRFIRPAPSGHTMRERPAAAVSAGRDLSYLTHGDLKALLKLRGLSAIGKTDALRARLAAVLG